MQYNKPIYIVLRGGISFYTFLYKAWKNKLFEYDIGGWVFLYLE